MNGLLLRPLAGSEAPGELVGIYSKDRTATRGYRTFSYPGFEAVTTTSAGLAIGLALGALLGWAGG